MVQHRESELWELSADEKRLLLITFVGGLASIVLGAVMIGAALALTRWEAHRHPDMLNLAMVTVLGVPAGIPVWRAGPAAAAPDARRRAAMSCRWCCGWRA